jgi:hypothetical protein
MASVQLTLEQIVGAIEQLSPTQRKALQRQMASWENSAVPATRTKSGTMGRRQKKRMSELLLKANARPLSPEEDAELNALVDDFESQMLANAEAMLRKKAALPNARGQRRPPKKQR